MWARWFGLRDTTTSVTGKGSFGGGDEFGLDAARRFHAGCAPRLPNWDLYSAAGHRSRRLGADFSRPIRRSAWDGQFVLRRCRQPNGDFRPQSHSLSECGDPRPSGFVVLVQVRRVERPWRSWPTDRPAMDARVDLVLRGLPILWHGRRARRLRPD